jgi:hypothetical protein
MLAMLGGEPMTALLPTATRDRLLACIRLAERPGTPGERLAAETAIGRLVVAHARAVIAALSETAPPEPTYDDGDPLACFADWRDAAQFCLQNGELSSWERNFLISILRFRRATPKQLNALREIADRTLGAMP